MKRKIVLSAEQVQEIIKLYQTGLTAKEVGKQFGYHGPVITRILKKNNVKLHKHRKLEDLTVEKAIEMYDEFETLDAMAKELKVSVEAIRQFFIKNNISYELRQKHTCDHDFFGRDTEEAFY